MINTTTGVLTTIAGNTIAGYSGDGGLATLASLNYPTSLCFDMDSIMLYVSDNGNQVIRRVNMVTNIITTYNTITTPSPSSVSLASRFLTTITGGISLYNIAIDTNNNLYISDSERCIIFKVSPLNITTIFAGASGLCGYAGDGQVVWSGKEILLSNPVGLAYNNKTNSLIFADNGNNRIRSISLISGNITTVAGNGRTGLQGDGSPATNASLSNPVSLAVDKFGNIYVSDRNNSVIRVINSETGSISIYIGTGKAGYNGEDLLSTTSQLNYPYAIAVDSNGNFFTADTGNNRIRYAKAINSMPTYLPTVEPTSYPSAIETFAPTFNASCGVCSPGSYVDSVSPTCCTLCPVDYYSDVYDSLLCRHCEYPYTNLIKGSTGCPNVYVDNQMISLYIIAGMIGFSFLFGVFKADYDTRRMFIVMVLPLLDVTSDFLVILAVTFYNNVIFALVVAFFIFPSYYFLYYLIINEKYPRWTVLPLKKGSNLIWLSTGPDKTTQDWIYPHVDNIPWCQSVIDLPYVGMMCSLIIWTLFVLFQVFYLALAFALIIINIPILLAWFVIGCLIFQSSLWSINYLWAIWLYIWCNDDLSLSTIEHDTNFSISDPRLRTSILVKLYIETVFEIILQIINLILLNTYGYSTIIGILSIIISFLNILNWIFYFYYYTPPKPKSEFEKDEKVDIYERNLLSPNDLQSRISSALSVSARKRELQARKCWKMLMLISHQYPRITKILAAEKIMNSKDLVSHMNISIRDQLVAPIPKGRLHNQMFAILSNFCMDEIRNIKVLSESEDFSLHDDDAHEDRIANKFKAISGIRTIPSPSQSPLSSPISSPKKQFKFDEQFDTVVDFDMDDENDNNNNNNSCQSSPDVWGNEKEWDFGISANDDIDFDMSEDIDDFVYEEIIGLSRYDSGASLIDSRLSHIDTVSISLTEVYLDDKPKQESTFSSFLRKGTSSSSFRDNSALVNTTAEATPDVEVNFMGIDDNMSVSAVAIRYNGHGEF